MSRDKDKVPDTDEESWAAWRYEFGSPDRNEQDFKELLLISPLHNVNNMSTYPATLLLTTEDDSFIPPQHSYKYLAQLQNIAGQNKEQTNPLLIRILPQTPSSEKTRAREAFSKAVDIFTFIGMHTATK